MTDQELRKLNREDLLELLIAQAKENERLTRQLETVQKKLASREIVLQEAGSIAQAAMQLSGVFTDAEDAAQRYLENLENIGRQKKAETEKREEQSIRFCHMMESDALRRCREMEETTRLKCQHMLEEWRNATFDERNQLLAGQTDLLDQSGIPDQEDDAKLENAPEGERVGERECLPEGEGGQP